MDKITLNNGFTLPSLGFGTYPMCGEVLTKALLSAIEAGYRLFDTAHAYPNEESLGKSLEIVFQEKGLKRKDVFLTTKIGENLDRGIPDGRLFYRTSENVKDIDKIVRTQFQDSLDKLRTDYVDLLLIHWPFPDTFVEIWKSLECLYREGKVKAIGVSNCRERHLLKILEISNIVPMVNQVEISPLNTRKELIRFCCKHQIILEIYSPLMCLRKREFITHPVMTQLVAKYGKNAAQIVLRWLVQQGLLPIPKSADLERQKQNTDIFDFQLAQEEMDLLDSLNKDYQYLPESVYCPGY